MNYAEAAAVLAKLTNEQLETLETAHDRYFCFAGISSFDAESDRQAEADRTTYAHLLLPDSNGRPSVSDEHTTAFMVAVTGLPEQCCLAWDVYAFCNLHGADWEERAAANGGIVQ